MEQSEKSLTIYASMAVVMLRFVDKLNQTLQLCLFKFCFDRISQTSVFFGGGWGAWCLTDNARSWNKIQKRTFHKQLLFLSDSFWPESSYLQLTIQKWLSLALRTICSIKLPRPIKTFQSQNKNQKVSCNVRSDDQMHMYPHPYPCMHMYPFLC